MGVVVRTTGGRVAGVAHGGLLAFKGIPYAAAPEGPLRFQAPAPPPPWHGVRPAHAFGVAPPQLPLTPGSPAPWRPEDGLDCLSVNVWTPGGRDDRLPVMVWIYGGGWKSGWSGDPAYDGANLARAGVVLVTFNYRVGFEGFGHVPDAPANRGFLDQIAALGWVRENIARFGGDPDNVTVFGESGGGASVASLLTAPAARGLFHRAIAQSMAGRYLPQEEARRIADLLAAALGVKPKALATLAPEALLAVQDAPLAAMEAEPGAWSTPEAITAYSPVIDGVTVVDKPWLAVRSGAAREVDLIAGYTHDEFSMFALQRGLVRPGLAATVRALPMLASMALSRLRQERSTSASRPPRRMRTVNLRGVAESLGLDATAPDQYRAAHPGMADARLYTEMFSDALFRMPSTWLVEAHTAAGGRGYLYDFTWPSPALGGALGASHLVDVPVTFGNTDGPIADFMLGGKPPGEDFEQLSKRLRAAWVSFAATGDPGWPQFTADEALTRIWNVEPAVVQDPLADSRRIWHASSGR
ncbi:carboxylesterase/lipase family protein [Streptomyces apocyni]|uniref:carboxylesterase/lipase family protein n=1 Tax=Streptomyces apocyni TaxID=2654677 RepID=UPI0012E9A78E|nr:carboxylesterase family protein [Streptomyces apocyni]